MEGLPYHPFLPLSQEKKEQLSQVLKAFEKRNDLLFRQILDTEELHDRHWEVYQEIDVNNFGHAVAATELFKLLNINKHETIMLYNTIKPYIEKTDISEYILKKCTCMDCLNLCWKIGAK